MTLLGMFWNKKWIFFDSVGFESMHDFVNNLVSPKIILAIAGVLSAIMISIDQFIEASIFSPAKGIYILFFTTLFDIMLGISVAVKEKRFDTYKLMRAWIRLVVQIIIIGLLHQSNMVWEMVNDWMVNTLLLAFVLTTLWSAFKNAYKLKWIQEDTYLILQRILSVDQIFNQFIRKFFKTPKK